MKRFPQAISGVTICMGILITSTSLMAKAPTSQVLDSGSLILHNRTTGVATAYRQGNDVDIVWNGENIAPYQLTRTVKPIANGNLMAIARIEKKTYLHEHYFQG